MPIQKVKSGSLAGAEMMTFFAPCFDVLSSTGAVHEESSRFPERRPRYGHPRQDLQGRVQPSSECDVR